MTARDAIFDRLRRAERTGYVPPVDEHARRSTLPLRLDEAARLRRFVDELAGLGVQCFVEDSAEDVRQRVRDIVGARSVLQWDSKELPYEVGSLFPNAATGASPRTAQAAADVGITGADAAIAETGTLALLSGAGKPRAASLLPPTHLALVRRIDIVSSMGEFFAARADAVASAACCSFITGPSRTADIELTLTLGVHGPGVVVVVVGP